MISNLISRDEFNRIVKGSENIPNKYGAERKESPMPELAGRSFASKLERDRAGELVIMLRAGLITQLVFHPRVLLTDAEISYHPDFAYHEKGSPVWEETKGYETDRWRIIRKLWAHYGPAPLRVLVRGHGGRIVLKEEIRP